VIVDNKCQCPNGHAVGYTMLQDIDTVAFVCRACSNAATFETGKRFTGNILHNLLASLDGPIFQYCNANIPFVCNGVANHFYLLFALRTQTREYLQPFCISPCAACFGVFCSFSDLAGTCCLSKVKLLNRIIATNAERQLPH
jgi:hypothetical protein